MKIFGSKRLIFIAATVAIIFEIANAVPGTSIFTQIEIQMKYLNDYWITRIIVLTCHFIIL